MKHSTKLICAALSAVAALAGPAASAHATTYPISTCTIESPARLATIDVEIANASDFCELVSQALGSEVFHSPLVVTESVEWIVGGTHRSCELQFKATNFRLTVWNALDACKWFTRRGTGWHSSPTAGL